MDTPLPQEPPTLTSFEEQWRGQLFKMSVASQVSNIGRTKLFRLLKTGQITAKRCGGANLIIGESLGRYVDQLPIWPNAS